ncbi:nicotinate-nucleotide adenylyltransferase [Bacillus massiliigorillae]|uniref:nicotinate-nucleotide adenylyltransferase n=1 Tax=Bacillus massiliigorillae TaxID=1243664 RepID=UPI0003A88890|nr:nicotinate-nucleotide adenylyltransferase [Bacillus massiliigorillae]
MKKVGILGGTFDPPHIGHVIVANEILTALELDEIRFMPNHTPPHKEKTQGVSNEDRVEMLRLSIKDNPKFTLELIELDSPGASYTFYTMEKLKEKEPDTAFYFIIGADMIEYLPKWHRIDELVGLVQFVGVQRPPFTTNTTYPIELIDAPLIYLSSSIIRKKVKNGVSIKYLVAPAVEEYIEENSLYET